jgi:hypothetical protein
MPVLIGRKAREAEAAVRTLKALGYVWNDGADRWKPPPTRERWVSPSKPVLMSTMPYRGEVMPRRATVTKPPSPSAAPVKRRQAGDDASFDIPFDNTPAPLASPVAPIVAAAALAGAGGAFAGAGASGSWASRDSDSPHSSSSDSGSSYSSGGGDGGGDGGGGGGGSGD